MGASLSCLQLSDHAPAGRDAEKSAEKRVEGHYKLVLVGAGESGKSTLFKQLLTCVLLKIVSVFLLLTM